MPALLKAGAGPRLSPKPPGYAFGMAETVDFGRLGPGVTGPTGLATATGRGDGAYLAAQQGRPGGGPVPAVVTLRPIASGLPIGFFGLVIAASVVGAQAYGFVPALAGKAIGLLLLATVLFQVIGGISCIMGRDVISATLMLTFAGVWLGTALIYLVTPPEGLKVLGIWYLALAPVIACLISSATRKLALSMVPAIGLPTFVVTAVWLIGGAKDHALGQVTGIFTWVLAAVALYAALALLLEDAKRKTVLPTLRRGAMKESFTREFDYQLTDVEHEAGVRRYV